MNHLRDTTASRDAGRVPRTATLVMNMFIPGQLPEVSSGWVLANRPEGLLLSGTGTSGFIRQAINGNTSSYLPLIMGMAMPRIVHARSRAKDAKNRVIMRKYVVALVMHKEDTGSLPPDLDALVAGNYLTELKLMENYATGKMEKPLYHGSPNLQVEDLRHNFILLAAPSAGPDGRRLAGCLDGSVQVLAEAAYQARMQRQQ